MLSKDEVKTIALHRANYDAVKRPNEREHQTRESVAGIMRAIREAKLENGYIDVDEIKGRKKVCRMTMIGRKKIFAR